MENKSTIFIHALFKTILDLLGSVRQNEMKYFFLCICIGSEHRMANAIMITFQLLMFKFILVSIDPYNHISAAIIQSLKSDLIGKIFFLLQFHKIFSS